MGLNKLVAFSCMSMTLACAGAARADTFSAGQFVTYTEAQWGEGGVAASLLTADYDSVYASTSGVVIVGVVGNPVEFALAFTSVDAVLAYLPATGTAGPLIASELNPTTTEAGGFGGDVLALKLNVDFSNSGFLQGSSSLSFGDLVLQNFPFMDELNGLTVNEFLADANTCLGGGPCVGLEIGSFDNIAATTGSLNAAFASGTPDSFAEDHLALPSSVTPAPEPSSLLLLAPALAGLEFLRRRRIKRKPPTF